MKSLLGYIQFYSTKEKELVEILLFLCCSVCTSNYEETTSLKTDFKWMVKEVNWYNRGNNLLQTIVFLLQTGVHHSNFVLMHLIGVLTCLALHV